MKTYTIKELEEITKLPRRTIRYYVSRGIVPPPTKGANSVYEESQLNRLLFARKLQGINMTLEQIYIYMKNLTDAEVKEKLSDAANHQPAQNKLRETMAEYVENYKGDEQKQEKNQKASRAALPLTEHLELEYYEPVDRETVELMNKIKDLCREEQAKKQQK